MITELPSGELIRLGARHRLGRAVAQGRYTVTLAREDPKVVAIVGTDFLDELEAEVGKLERATAERDVAQVDSTSATRIQNDALEGAKLWRRAFIHRVLAARLRGARLPEDAGKMNAHGSNPNAIARDVRRMVALGQGHQAVLAPLGVTNTFLERGTALAEALVAADQEQEVARLQALPAKVQELYAQKGRVYVGVKQLNHLGRSVHAEDSGKASQYNLDLLYRRQRRRANDGEAPPDEGDDD